MDIVKFWNDVITNYNTTNKCGFCWSFGAPLSKSGINMSDTDACCVNVFLTDYGFETIHEQLVYGSEKKSCEHYFNLWFLVPTNLGINNYNEIDNHLISESHWEKIYKPLQECIGCSIDIDFCANLGYPLNIKKWKATQVVDSKFDANYKGFMVQVHFSQNI